EDVRLARLADHVFERTGFLARAPARADDADVDAVGLALDDVVDRLDGAFGRAEAALAHELQGHDLDPPVDARDAFVVVALGPDDAGAVRAVAVLVHRVARLADGAEAVVVVYDAELFVEIHVEVVGPVPHVVQEVGVRVVDAAVEDGDDDLIAAVRLRPRGEGADVGLRLAVALPRVDEAPLLGEQGVVRAALEFGRDEARADARRFERVGAD